MPNTIWLMSLIFHKTFHPASKPSTIRTIQGQLQEHHPTSYHCFSEKAFAELWLLVISMTKLGPFSFSFLRETAAWLHWQQCNFKFLRPQLRTRSVSKTLLRTHQGIRIWIYRHEYKACILTCGRTVRRECATDRPFCLAGWKSISPTKWRPQLVVFPLWYV